MQQTSVYDLLKLSGLDIDYSKISSDVGFNSICADSRKVKSGDLFICIPCQNAIQNATQALDKGAAVILATNNIIALFDNLNQTKTVFISHENPRLALSLIAKAYFGKQPQTLMAITGTNGKSSVVSMLRQFWSGIGQKAASFGTIGVEVDGLKPEIKLPEMPELTTYDSISYFHLLASLSDAQINHVALEASSHGLDQYRIHGSNLSVAGFTNLTQDHLDYHQTMDQYFEAKAKLFSEVLQPGKFAVINANSAYVEPLLSIASKRNLGVLTFALDAPADLTATNIKIRENKIIFDLLYKKTTYTDVILNLAGAFQVENVLCAIGMLLCQDISIDTLIPLVPRLKSVKGRMELVGTTPLGGSIYVDYAHTPDALERALKSLRAHTNNSLFVVFGCGGDRQKTKRPLMGKISCELADKVVITDDNPRSEDPQVIRKEIIEACTSSVIEIANRLDAIKFCITELKKGDTLLIAGKGHESKQIVGSKIYIFNDKNEAEKILEGIR